MVDSGWWMLEFLYPLSAIRCPPSDIVPTPHPQNTYFNANCRLRACNAERIWPNVLVCEIFVAGSIGRKLFVTLKASARTSKCWASRRAKVLESDMSNDHVLGP